MRIEAKGIIGFQTMAAIPPRGEVWTELANLYISVGSEVRAKDDTAYSFSREHDLTHWHTDVHSEWGDTGTDSWVTVHRKKRRAWATQTGKELFVAKGKPGQSMYDLIFWSDPGPRPGDPSSVDTGAAAQEISVFADRMEELGLSDFAAHLRTIVNKPKLLFERWRIDRSRFE